MIDVIYYNRQSLSLAEMEQSISVAQGTDNPMYYYEGHDYTEEAKKADADVLGALLKRKPTSLQSGESSSLEPLTPRRRVSSLSSAFKRNALICIYSVSIAREESIV
mgnify:CR=1 FL=1